MSQADLTPSVLRAAFAAFPSGVVAVAAMNGQVPAGLAASSFCAVSLEPPLVSVCIAHTSTTWPTLRESPHLGLSVLAEEHGEVARTLAAKNIDRFTNVDWERTEGGAVLIRGAALSLECTLVAELPAGDHDIALLQIQRLTSSPEVPPLVFHSSQFRRIHASPSVG